MSGYKHFWKTLSPAQLNAAIQIFSLVAIFFEGYDQGVMGGVNSAPNYISVVDIGSNGVVTQQVKQGGIVSIYYLGAIFGCFVGGYIADTIGRINGIFYASMFATVGGALQSATQDSNMILVARVISGIGVGALTGITPVYLSEVASQKHRGAYLGLVWIANYLGISVAYWLSFGLAFVDNGQSALRWRFILGFQCIPAIILLLGVKLLPDSPRYLTATHQNEAAFEVLSHVRVNVSKVDLETEFAEMVEASKHHKRSNPFDVIKILVGWTTQEGHITRRAWLCVWLQIMASWTGITAVTVYSSVLFRQAGFSTLTQSGLSGGVNSIGIIGTIISAYVVDKFGRRRCLMWGAAGLCLVNMIAGGLYEAALRDPSKASQIAPGAVLMLFFFNLLYAATWGTVAFLLPAEIFPSEMRALGNGFGITGWAIGVGWTTLVNPTIFVSLQNRTYFLFGGLNLIWIFIVYCLYPESSGRSLESIDVLFSHASPWNWVAEKAYSEQEIEKQRQAASDESSEKKNDEIHDSLNSITEQSLVV